MFRNTIILEDIFMPWFFIEKNSISKKEMTGFIIKAAEEAKKRINNNPKKVLLLPPDITRAHSGAGWITEILYNYFSKTSPDVHVIPTLGQHLPHSPYQNKWMYGSIPESKIHIHDWINGAKIIGEVPADYVKKVSKGRADWAIPVSLNKMLVDEKWDLIINVGHIVPHEVLGFANHNKNYFIGLGGKEMICPSHMMAACCGIENNLGCYTTPLRHCFNKAENDYLSYLPDMFIQLVMAYDEEGKLNHTGLYVGDNINTYLKGAEASFKQNITIVKPLKKVVAYMQEDEFYSTWVSNKAIYRTRMAMADQGELLIIAPGLKRFGEQKEVDDLIRKYGYSGTERIMSLWKKEPDLQDLTHGTAHLIHGSSEGRFKITYAPGLLTKKEIESVNYNYADLNETLKKYDIKKLKNGFNTLPDGETIYYISTPSAGLWSTEEKMKNREFS